MRILILLVFLSIACNPVKQVMKDPEKLNEVADELVRNGLCVTETTIVNETIDTMVVFEISEPETIYIQGNRCTFDTILTSGTRLVYLNGILVVDEKVKTKVVTKQVEKVVRDKTYEDLLKDDILVCKDSISFYKGSIQATKDHMKKLEKKLFERSKYLYIIIALIALYFLFKVYRVIKPLP